MIEGTPLQAALLAALPQAWVEALPLWLLNAQLSLRDALAALNLVDYVDGQAAWPWGQRLAIETLAIDAGLSRRLLLALLAAAILLSSLALGLIILVGQILWRQSGRGSPRFLRAARRQDRSVVLSSAPPSVLPCAHPSAHPTVSVLPVVLPAALSALLLALLVPWSSLGLLWRSATATSFHQAPSGASAAELATGLSRFQSHCASCHGSDGRGETARAAQLPVWPPRLTGDLLWRRADGELYGHVRDGMRTRDGRQSMPGFADELSSADTWAVLAALRLLAGGQALKEQGQWPWPVAAPDFAIDCGEAGSRTLAGWRGQRVMIAVLGPQQAAPQPDPRYETVVLRTGPDRDARAAAAATGEAAAADADAAAAASAEANANANADAGNALQPGGQGCQVVDAHALRGLLATVAQGSDSGLDGLQLLIDRDGWLRARGRPEAAGWRDEDLVCRTSAAAVAEPLPTALPVLATAGQAQVEAGPGAPGGLPGGAAEQGLDRLIQRIDADPITPGLPYILAHGRRSPR